MSIVNLIVVFLIVNDESHFAECCYAGCRGTSKLSHTDNQ
jgi:hypothetical protein